LEFRFGDKVAFGDDDVDVYCDVANSTCHKLSERFHALAPGRNVGDWEVVDEPVGHHLVYYVEVTPVLEFLSEATHEFGIRHSAFLFVVVRERSGGDRCDRPYFDTSGAGIGDLACQLDGAVKVLDVNDLITVERLRGGRHWAIVYQGVTIAHPHDLGRVDPSNGSPPTISPESMICWLKAMYSAPSALSAAVSGGTGLP
jgi:hypothetical protein